MRRDTFKLLVLAGIVAFAVLYGMELSSRGIENVNGKYETIDQGSPDDPAAADEWTLPSSERTKQKQRTQSGAAGKSSGKATDMEDMNDWDAELYGIPRRDHKPLSDRVSGAAAGALHSLSKGGIKFVVSIFDKVTG